MKRISNLIPTLQRHRKITRLTHIKNSYSRAINECQFSFTTNTVKGGIFPRNREEETNPEIHFSYLGFQNVVLRK